MNAACAVLFRKKRKAEILSYLAAGLIELGIFIFALLLHLAILTRVPYHLPRGLPFNRAEIGAHRRWRGLVPRRLLAPHLLRAHTRTYRKGRASYAKARSRSARP